MGRIERIYDPENWIIEKEGLSKLKKNDVVYNMVIGEIDDDYTFGYICEWVSKINYEKLLNKELQLIKKPYSESPIKLFDNNKEVDLVLKETKPNNKTLLLDIYKK